jgi:hypothetical protein
MGEHLRLVAEGFAESALTVSRRLGGPIASWTKPHLVFSSVKTDGKLLLASVRDSVGISV